MAIIASPPSYITRDQFVAQSPLLDVSVYPGDQLQDILNRASGEADAIMHRSLLAQEKTLYYRGTGTSTLTLDESPLIYIRQISFAQPGLGGLIIPTQNLLVDYAAGQVTTFVPLLLQGSGFVSTFPRGIDLSIRLAYGYGYALSQPTWTARDVTTAGALALTPGSYDIAVTARTAWGETTATVQQYTTTTGFIAVLVNPVLGAERYVVYIAPTTTPATTPTLAMEIPSVTFDARPIGATLASLDPSQQQYAQTLPTTDTSAHQMPYSVVEATRLLALDIIYNAMNYAFRGIMTASHVKFGTLTTRAGVTLLYSQAAEMLRTYQFTGVL